MHVRVIRGVAITLALLIAGAADAERLERTFEIQPAAPTGPPAFEVCVARGGQCDSALGAGGTLVLETDLVAGTAQLDLTGVTIFPLPGIPLPGQPDSQGAADLFLSLEGLTAELISVGALGDIYEYDIGHVGSGSPIRVSDFVGGLSIVGGPDFTPKWIFRQTP